MNLNLKSGCQAALEMNTRTAKYATVISYAVEDPNFDPTLAVSF